MPYFVPEKYIIQLQTIIIIHMTKSLGRFKTVFGNDTNAQLSKFILLSILISHLKDRKLWQQQK